jgi:hypothetical protein
MKILALERNRPGITNSDFEPHLKAEAQAVSDLMQSGTIREIYFRDNTPQAVIILEAESAQAAQETLARLPLVKAGLIKFQVIGLRVYPGLERLSRT